MAAMSNHPSQGAGDRMFWEMQNFDFCPNLIKFYQIYSNLTKFQPNLGKFDPNLPELA